MRSEPSPDRRQSSLRRTSLSHDASYRAVCGDVSKIIDAARESAARSVNAAMTAAYWLIGRRIVEFEQLGGERAEYGAALIERLAEDLTVRFGRGFSRQNVQNMRLFSLSFPPGKIRQTLSGKSARLPAREIRQTPSGEFDSPSVEVGFDDLLSAFPLPWSAYVRLLSVRSESARQFYETEALRGGWSVRQLDRQIGSQFYERTALSKSRATMLAGGQRERPEDIALPGEQIKDPFVLEFLDLKVFGVVTNRSIAADELIWWSRQRCGKGEEVHSVLKSDLAGGRLPSGLFGANAAWWAISVLAFNLNSAMKRLVLGEQWVGKRLKAVRFALIALPGRVMRHARRLIIRLARGHPSYELLLRARQRILALAAEPYRA